MLSGAKASSAVPALLCRALSGSTTPSGDFELQEELLALLATGHMHPGLQAWLCGTLGEPGLRRLARWGLVGRVVGVGRLRGGGTHGGVLRAQAWVGRQACSLRAVGLQLARPPP
jgi:hypothetical protein